MLCMCNFDLHSTFTILKIVSLHSTFIHVLGSLLGDQSSQDWITILNTLNSLINEDVCLAFFKHSSITISILHTTNWKMFHKLLTMFHVIEETIFPLHSFLGPFILVFSFIKEFRVCKMCYETYRVLNTYLIISQGTAYLYLWQF